MSWMMQQEIDAIATAVVRRLRDTAVATGLSPDETDAMLQQYRVRHHQMVDNTARLERIIGEQQARIVELERQLQKATR